MRLSRILRVCGGIAAVAGMGLVVSAAAAADGDKDRGKPIYMEHCAVCHGDSGQGADTGPELFYGPGYSDTVKIVAEGKDSGKKDKMPAFADMLSEQDIADVAAYVTGVIEGG